MDAPSLRLHRNHGPGPFQGLVVRFMFVPVKAMMIDIPSPGIIDLTMIPFTIQTSTEYGVPPWFDDQM